MNKNFDKEFKDCNEDIIKELTEQLEINSSKDKGFLIGDKLNNIKTKRSCLNKLVRLNKNIETLNKLINQCHT